MRRRNSTARAGARARPALPRRAEPPRHSPAADVADVGVVGDLIEDDRAAVDRVVRLMSAQPGEFFFLASKSRDGHFRDYAFSGGDGTATAS